MRVLLYSFFALKIIFQMFFWNQFWQHCFPELLLTPGGSKNILREAQSTFFFFLGEKKKDKYLLEKAKSNKVLRETTKNKQYLEASFSHITL